ncbi:hypothetical protein [Micromonospora sp. NPDC049171]|uniref:hypothetical protein n=1 Tax=Micromonospora sp. NPDC049171 TaxID=3155770 RepID=UPI0033D3936B
MGMMVTARRVEAAADEIRYEFGLDGKFDRILTIDPRTLGTQIDDGDVDSAAGAITAKIVKAWRSSGEFPTRMLFAS